MKMLRAAETVRRTDTGRQRRGNEDSSLARPPVFVVADGMGGAQAGEVASQIAVEAFEQGLPSTGTPEQRLAEIVQEANRRIHDVSRVEHERAGMGTTLTAAFLDDRQVAIAHVGDSRAYLYRDGGLQREPRFGEASNATPGRNQRVTTVAQERSGDVSGGCQGCPDRVGDGARAVRQAGYEPAPLV